MLDPYDGDLLELYVDVKVINPKLEDFSHISYEIVIETNNFSFSEKNSAVRRRFSDFAVLNKLISKEFPAMKSPSLPPKSLFSDHFNPEFIEKRRCALEEYIKKIVSQKMYLSSKALHLFLQSSYTMNEIKDIIHGKGVIIESQTGYISNSRISQFHTHFNSDANSAHSSHAELEVSIEDSSPVVQNNDEVLPNVSTKCDSPSGSKKVSFCEQVTVAQIHVD